MIIEIKDLPPGRKVNRILVDITFEDSGPNLIETEFNDSDRETHTKTNKPSEQPKPSEPIEDREHKDIPEEMMNMEF